MRGLISLVLLSTCLLVMAQKNEVLSNDIKTLIVERNGQWNQFPYIELNTNDYLRISFDDLTHEYHRYRYRIEPMTWDWRLNERLLTSEFLRHGIGDEPIDEYKESVNTTVLYTHYTFNFPNKNTSIALSGNYRLVIYNDDDERDVIILPFYVVENRCNLSATVATNTDIDFNNNHQQLTLSLVPDATLGVHYPETELHAVVMQNMRPSSAVNNPKPDYITPTGLKWEHCRALIFAAGNEYKKFEMTTLRHGGVGVDNIRWHEPYYHATLITDNVATNYIYDEEQNGSFYINDTDNYDSATEADYVFVHFSLDAPADIMGNIYINGEFTNDQFDEKYLMRYNAESHCYENTQLLKLGYYNYQYLYVGGNSGKPSTREIQGDFYQTENRYTVLAYYCERGARSDRLIGIRDFRFQLSR